MAATKGKRRKSVSKICKFDRKKKTKTSVKKSVAKRKAIKKGKKEIKKIVATTVIITDPKAFENSSVPGLITLDLSKRMIENIIEGPCYKGKGDNISYRFGGASFKPDTYVEFAGVSEGSGLIAMIDNSRLPGKDWLSRGDWIDIKNDKILKKDITAMKKKNDALLWFGKNSGNAKIWIHKNAKGKGKGAINSIIIDNGSWKASQKDVNAEGDKTPKRRASKVNLGNPPFIVNDLVPEGQRETPIVEL